MPKFRPYKFRAAAPFARITGRPWQGGLSAAERGARANIGRKADAQTIHRF